MSSRIAKFELETALELQRNENIGRLITRCQYAARILEVFDDGEMIVDISIPKIGWRALRYNSKTGYLSYGIDAFEDSLWEDGIAERLTLQMVIFEQRGAQICPIPKITDKNVLSLIKQVKGGFRIDTQKLKRA